jgi:repressor LexA
MVSAATASAAHRAATGLTARQRELLVFIERTAASGRPPSRADIASHFGITRATVQQHVVALERHGALRRLPGARGLAPARAATPAPRIHTVPVLGRVAAGVPLLAVEDASEAVAVPEGLFRSVPDVLLRVAGDSMIGAGILDGDLVAIALRPDAESGDIVVARLDDEITLKRLRRRAGAVELWAENPAFAPIRMDPTREFAIEGVVLGVVRRL